MKPSARERIKALLVFSLNLIVTLLVFPVLAGILALGFYYSWVHLGPVAFFFPLFVWIALLFGFFVVVHALVGWMGREWRGRRDEELYQRSEWQEQLNALTLTVFADYSGRRALARQLGVLETTITKWRADGATPNHRQTLRIGEVYQENLMEISKCRDQQQREERPQRYERYRPVRRRKYERSRPVRGQRSERGAEYDRYMNSEAWREKAEEAKQRVGHRCQLCNKGHTVLHVHHRTYERLREELPEDLIVLCAGCHSKFHDKLSKRRRRTGARR